MYGNKQKTGINFLGWRLEGHWQNEQNPDPLVRGTDPRIRIHTKMSRIRNTAFLYLDCRSAGDPDSHVLGLPVRIRYPDVRNRILPFSDKGVERTEITLAK